MQSSSIKTRRSRNSKENGLVIIAGRLVTESARVTRRDRPSRLGDLQQTRISFACAMTLCAMTLFGVGCNTKQTPHSGTPVTQDASAAAADPVEKMRAAMEVRDWQLADRYSAATMIAHPDDPRVVTDVAKVAALNGRKREAAMLLVDAAQLQAYRPGSGIDFAVQALIDVGEMYEVIALLEHALEVSPNNDQQRRQLVGFLGEAQRIEKIPPHLQKLIEHRRIDVPLLTSVTETSIRRFSNNTPDKFMARNPADHRVRLAKAFDFLEEHEAAKAVKVLQEILLHHPDFAPAHAMYGQALMAAGRLDDIPEWIAGATVDSQKYADHWLTLGDWATESQRYAEAARAYHEATKRDPDNSTAWTRLIRSIRLLRASDSEFRDTVTDEQLQLIEDRLADVMEFRLRYDNFETSDQKSQRYAAEVAESLMILGRNWEAEAWSAVATTLAEDPSNRLASIRNEIMRHLQEDQRWQAKKSQPALDIDLSSLPINSDFSPRSGSSHAALAPRRVSTDQLRLTEESIHWGLDSVGAGNNPDDAGMTPLIRSTAAGGGAIDYDLDGSPDLLVVGAGGTMLRRDSQPNQLLRNLENRFQNVTSHAGVGDRGFGQGVAVGDFNEDGFPDLFFANLGKNRLFRNNGDGTFTDCADQLQDQGLERWTTSGAFADINRDGISDLLTINYCDAETSVDKACPNDEGILGPCPPLEFPADHDQFFLGAGDGRLVDTTAELIPTASPGRGLGIVAGALDGHSLGVYVANDMSTNALYRLPQPGSRLLIESAAASGVGLDGRTLTQASMGIASSDFDGDGDLDFYVTGFVGEYNVMYEQISPGLWSDETSRLDLVRPTLELVGFGTEAIDLDGDGLDEIIVTNGHIGDFPDPTAVPYEQPLQLFRRGRNGTFVLVDDDSWGDYFSTPHVGRALWTMDVNRDGRQDVMITHATEQIRLLVNRGTDANHRIAFQLVGTRSSRDAVGAVIRFQCGGRERSLWALSGDGYLCSNERILLAGLGDADQVTDLTVTWQDGTVDDIGRLDADAQYVIVQGAAEAFRRQPFAQ